MLKYVPEMTSVVLEEIPDRLTLAVEVSNCRGNCPGCHSPFLREDVGEELTAAVIDRLVGDNFGVNCFLFLGEGRDPAALLALAAHVRSLGLAVALYSGREDLEDALWEAFDYVKVGPYRAECGPLNARTTNQRLYRALAEGEEAQPGAGNAPAVPGPVIIRAGRRFADITARFWRRGIDPLAGGESR